MDNNRFVIKNSILLTICCFLILNFRNIMFFNFEDDNNIGFTAFFYTFTILALFAIFIIAFVYYLPRARDVGEEQPTIMNAINRVFELIHGKDNFVPPIKNLGIKVFNEDIINILVLFLPIFFIIMGSVNAGYATRKKKHNLKFSSTKNIVLGILMFSVMFLFFQLIFISIVNNVTRSQVNTNFNLYMFLFLFLLFFYSIIYCVFVDREKKEKTNYNNNRV